MDSIVNCAVYSEGRRIADVELEDISEALLIENQFVWLGLKDPDEELMIKIQEGFGLHDLAIEDAHRAHQRPKIEAYGDTYFIVLRTAYLDEETKKIAYGETHFFLGKNFLISIRHGSTSTYKVVRARCESTPRLLNKGPGFVLYAVMDFIVDQYFPIIDVLDEELDVLENKVFKEKFDRNTPAHIYRLKSRLIEVKRAISPLVEICNRLMRFDSELIHDDIRPYFRDIYDHSIRINEVVDNTKEQLATVLEANFSLASINQNEVSKQFAGWAAIIGVPTMIAGVYGMNFRYMPELQWQYGYPLVLVVIIAICLVLYWFLRRAGWL